MFKEFGLSGPSECRDGYEGKETFSNGSSEPHMRRVNESPSVYSCMAHSDGTYGVSHLSRSVMDKAMMRSIATKSWPSVLRLGNLEKPGPDMSGGGPERNEVE